MTTHLLRFSLAPAFVCVLLTSAPVLATHGGGAPTNAPPPDQSEQQPAPGRGMMGCAMMMGADQHADMQLFQALIAHRAEITRTVTLRLDGIETVTGSSNPEVTRLLQKHVGSMLAHVKEARPIHQRDPLFAEIFRYADRIEAEYELTPTGVRVVETSRDPYVVKLLQAHAAVVDAFIANGHAEMMRNHPLPPR
jgi:hypothetical protein